MPGLHTTEVGAGKQGRVGDYEVSRSSRPVSVMWPRPSMSCMTESIHVRCWHPVGRRLRVVWDAGVQI